MDYNEFKKSVLGLLDNRTHKVTGSLGVYDAYKWLRKNKWLDINQSLSEHDFYAIIRRVNEYLALELINGKDIILPNKMGVLELRKHRPTIDIVDGKVKSSLPIDWDKTLKLWYEDEESFHNKTLIRIEEKEVFRIYYNKHKADYNNKSFYEFTINRDIKRCLKDNIRKGNIDAFNINRND